MAEDPDALAKFFGQTGFNKNPSPKPQEKPFYPDLQTGPHIEHPFRGKIPEGVQMEFDTFLSRKYSKDEPLFDPHPDYLMLIHGNLKSTAVIALNRSYYDKVPKHSPIGLNLDTFDMAGNMSFSMMPSGVFVFQGVRKYIEMSMQTYMQRIFVDSKTGHIKTHFGISFEPALNVVYDKDGNFEDVETADWASTIYSTRDKITEPSIKYLAEDKKVKYSRGPFSYILAPNADKLDVEYFQGDDFKGKAILPMKIVTDAIMANLAPPQLFANPLKAHPEFDRMWMTSNLLDIMGIKWKPHVEQKPPRSRQQILEDLEKNP